MKILRFDWEELATFQIVRLGCSNFKFVKIFIQIICKLDLLPAEVS